MGLSGYDQTACLAGDAQPAAEDHSRKYWNRRNLSIEQQKRIRANNTKITTISISSNKNKTHTAGRV